MIARASVLPTPLSSLYCLFSFLEVLMGWGFATDFAQIRLNGDDDRRDPGFVSGAGADTLCITHLVADGSRQSSPPQSNASVANNSHSQTAPLASKKNLQRGGDGSKGRACSNATQRRRGA